jgi:hypothetical protein
MGNIICLPWIFAKIKYLEIIVTAFLLPMEWEALADVF